MRRAGPRQAGAGTEGAGRRGKGERNGNGAAGRPYSQRVSSRALLDTRLKDMILPTDIQERLERALLEQRQQEHLRDHGLFPTEASAHRSVAYARGVAGRARSRCRHHDRFPDAAVTASNVLV